MQDDKKLTVSYQISCIMENLGRIEGAGLVLKMMKHPRPDAVVKSADSMMGWVHDIAASVDCLIDVLFAPEKESSMVVEDE